MNPSPNMLLSIDEHGWLHGPGVTILHADPSNFIPDRRHPIEMLINHITSGHPHAEGVAQMWQRPFNKSSAHVVIGQAGEIFQCVSFLDRAQHAHHDMNEISIGIEHCAREPNEPAFPKNDPGLPVTPEQVESSAQVQAAICDYYGVSPDRSKIQGHAEADTQTTHQNCPEGVAGGWPWDSLISRIRALLSEQLSEQTCAPQSAS